MKQDYAVRGINGRVIVEYPIGNTVARIPVGSGFARLQQLSMPQFLGYIKPLRILSEEGELSRETLRAMMHDIASCLILTRNDMASLARRLISGH